MKQLLTTLIFIIGLVSCKEQNEQADSKTTEIQNYFKDLKKTKETKFEGGDYVGTTYIFNNTDSSIVKVLVKYSAGDYGNGQQEYLVVDNRLIYQRDSIVDWLAIKSPIDSSDYKLSESIFYFNADSTGTKTSKAVYSMTLDFNDEKKKDLKTKKVDSLALTKTDYIKALEELNGALGLK